jgi:hypothetical protein
VQKLIDQTKRQLGLMGVEYTSLHLRGKYTRIEEDPHAVAKALRCAASLGRTTDATRHPSSHRPIFVASDSATMAHMAVRLAKQQQQEQEEQQQYNWSRPVVARTDYHQHPPLHIDTGADFLNAKSDDWKRHNVSEYHSVFADLFLLSDAQCVAAGIGNYGKWGSLLSKNVSCFANYETGEGCP